MREKRRGSLISNVVTLFHLIKIFTFFFFCLVSRSRYFAHFRRNHCRIMAAKVGFAGYIGLWTWMGPLSCHTGSIAVVIALSKVLDNNIVVYCILNITCKKNHFCVVYLCRMYFYVLFSSWCDWNSVCTSKNETPINKSKPSF